MYIYIYLPIKVSLEDDFNVFPKVGNMLVPPWGLGFHFWSLSRFFGHQVSRSASVLYSICLSLVENVPWNDWRDLIRRMKKCCLVFFLMAMAMTGGDGKIQKIMKHPRIHHWEFLQNVHWTAATSIFGARHFFSYMCMVVQQFSRC